MLDPPPQRRNSSIAALPIAEDAKIPSTELPNKRPAGKQAIAPKSTSLPTTPVQGDQAGNLGLLPFFPSLRPTSVFFPPEIWLNIQSNYIPGPRILYVGLRKETNTLQVVPPTEPIPRAFYTTKNSLGAGLTDHKIIPRSILHEPALFNPKTDVLYFKSVAALTVFVNIPNALASTRPLMVRSIAINLKSIWRSEDREVALDVAQMLRLLGTVEKVIMVKRPPPPADRPRHPGPAPMDDFLRILSQKHEEASKIWGQLEEMGKSIANKWEVPTILHVGEDSEVFGVLEDIRVSELAAALVNEN